MDLFSWPTAYLSLVTTGTYATGTVIFGEEGTIGELGIKALWPLKVFLKFLLFVSLPYTGLQLKKIADKYWKLLIIKCI